MAAGALATFAGSAGAAPKPTVSQVQKSVNRLTSQEDQAAQQYDQSEQQLSSAKQRLALVNREVKTDQAKFESMRSEIAAIASAAYENGNMTSMGALLTSNNPQAVLSQASVLLQLSSDRSAQVTSSSRRPASSSRLSSPRSGPRRPWPPWTPSAWPARSRIGKSLSQKKALLDTLTAQQKQTVTTTSTIGNGGTTKATNPVPVSGAAGQAVAYAYSKLGDPYVYGATGPSSFDCSGLVQAAWASAGVAIPRTTYEQVAAAAGGVHLQPAARRSPVLRRGRPRGHLRRRRLPDRRAADRRGRGEGRAVRLVQREPGQRREALNQPAQLTRHSGAPGNVPGAPL